MDFLSRPPILGLVTLPPSRFLLLVVEFSFGSYDLVIIILCLWVGCLSYRSHVPRSSVWVTNSVSETIVAKSLLGGELFLMVGERGPPD